MLSNFGKVRGGSAPIWTLCPRNAAAAWLPTSWQKERLP
jgi:hypothetical protein